MKLDTREILAYADRLELGTKPSGPSRISDRIERFQDETLRALLKLVCDAMERKKKKKNPAQIVTIDGVEYTNPKKALEEARKKAVQILEKMTDQKVFSESFGVPPEGISEMALSFGIFGAQKSVLAEKLLRKRGIFLNNKDREDLWIPIFLDAIAIHISPYATGYIQERLLGTMPGDRDEKEKVLEQMKKAIAQRMPKVEKYLEAITKRQQEIRRGS